MRYKINDVAKLIGLSRSTLLYYERIGLIKPEKDKLNDYRLFTKEEINKLKKICTYREMGIPLKDIKLLLTGEDNRINNIFEKQLASINEQIRELRKQQRKILEMCNIARMIDLDKKTWIEILRKSGLDDEGMSNWHKEFEKNAPEAHQDFLESLGLSELEIRKIRKWSKVTQAPPLKVAQASPPENCTSSVPLENSFHNLFQPFNKDCPLDISHRNLPHWEQIGTTYFVTFRLADSISYSQLKQWKNDRAVWLKNHTEPYTVQEKKEYSKLFSERINYWLDQGYGECILANDKIADIIEKTLNHFNTEKYLLGEWVIMPNHVHLILMPVNGYRLSEIMHSIKSFTAHEINKTNNTERDVWQHESYDHIVRNKKNSCINLKNI